MVLKMLQQILIWGGNKSPCDLAFLVSGTMLGLEWVAQGLYRKLLLGVWGLGFRVEASASDDRRLSETQVPYKPEA